MSASIWNPEGTQAVPALPAVNPVTFIKGTALAPGINFVGDADTGVWSQDNGYINFTVNGVNVLTIDPSGNILGNKFASGAELDLASSATCDIGGVVSNNVRITGNNSISSFGTNYRGPMFVRFASALTLSNSINLVCPGGSSIVVSPGDSCIVTPKASGGVANGWVIISYQSSAPLLNAVTSINSGQLAGMRNRIINGDCRIAQRGNVALVNNSLVYGGADRFAIALNGFAGATGTANQITGLGTPSRFGQSAYVATTGVGTIDIRQRIEAANTTDLAGKTITVSALVVQDSGAAVNFYFDLNEPTVVDTFAALNFLVSSPAVMIPNNVATPVTFTYTLGAGVGIKGLALSSIFSLTSAVTNKNFIVTEVQVELGTVATPFERRNVGAELAMCQRYYEIVSAVIGNQMFLYFPFPYKITKRANPTLSITPALTGGGSLGLGGNPTQACRLETVTSDAPADQVIKVSAEL